MPTREAIVTAARRFIGTPYHHQGALAGAGCDCIGLLRGVWRELYGAEPEDVPPYTPDVGETGRAEIMLAVAQRHLVPVAPDLVRAGDAVVFRMRRHVIAKHVAIVSGTTTMIHAQSNDRVREVTLGLWWRRHAVAGFAFPGVSD